MHVTIPSWIHWLKHISHFITTKKTHLPSHNLKFKHFSTYNQIRKNVSSPYLSLAPPPTLFLLTTNSNSTTPPKFVFYPFSFISPHTLYNVSTKKKIKTLFLLFNQTHSPIFPYKKKIKLFFFYYTKLTLKLFPKLPKLNK